MTDNRKKNFIIEDTSDEQESITSELDIPVEKLVRDTIVNGESNSLSSIQIPDTSSPVLLSDNDYPLEEEYKNINCNDENFFTPECNKFQLKKEIAERNYLSENED